MCACIRVCVRARVQTNVVRSLFHEPRDKVIVFAKDLYSRVPRENLTFRSFEPTLTAFWTKSNYTVANPDAIFTHNRLDRTLGVAGRWVTVDV